MEKYINAIKDFFDRLSDSYIFNPGKKTITIAFCIIVSVICIVSGIFIINERAEDTTVTADATENNTSTSVRTDEDSPLTANILFALEGSDKLELLGVMRLSSADKSVKMSFLSPETYCSLNNMGGTMNNHYKSGGAAQLVQAVGELADISIERFIIADYSSFKSMLNRIGDMNVVLEHEVICGQDAASLVIEKGPQTLIPEMMTKYFGFLCSDVERYDYEIAKTMMSYGEKLFCTDNEADTEKSFSSILSTFHTDISAQDFVKYKTAIRSLADKEVLSGVTLAESLSELK